MDDILKNIFGGGFSEGSGSGFPMDLADLK